MSTAIKILPLLKRATFNQILSTHLAFKSLLMHFLKLFQNTNCKIKTNHFKLLPNFYFINS